MESVATVAPAESAAVASAGLPDAEEGLDAWIGVCAILQPCVCVCVVCVCVWGGWGGGGSLRVDCVDWGVCDSPNAFICIVIICYI